MIDKKRLIEIKEARKRILDEKSFQKKCILLNSFEELGYLDWLIEQAEKTEIYKEALENIEALSFFSDGFSDKEKFVAALYHAKKALEGTDTSWRMKIIIG